MPKNALEVKNAELSLAGRKILNGLNFSLRKGEFAVLLGSNGAGKSSLIRAITGQLALTQGTVQRGSVALIAQDPRQSCFDDLTVGENFQLISRKDCRLHAAQFHPRLAELYDRPVHLLSGGERQALALALCLLNPPDLLLLDEHTSALDPLTASRIMELTEDVVHRFEVCTLMCTHNLEHAEAYGNRVLGMSEGRIVVDAPYLTREDLLQRCYG